jgi:hypothetical protein
MTMPTAKLYARDGLHYDDESMELKIDEDKFVAEVEVFPFNEWPRVILWGIRCFAFIGDLRTSPRVDTEPGFYKEVFYFCAVETVSRGANADPQEPEPAAQV